MDICVGEGLGRSKAECQGGIVYIGAEEAAALSDWKLLYVARHLDEADLKMQASNILHNCMRQMRTLGNNEVC